MNSHTNRALAALRQDWKKGHPLYRRFWETVASPEFFEGNIYTVAEVTQAQRVAQLMDMLTKQPRILVVGRIMRGTGTVSMVVDDTLGRVVYAMRDRAARDGVNILTDAQRGTAAMPGLGVQAVWK